MEVATRPLLQGAHRLVELKVVLDNVLERVHAEFEGLLHQASMQLDQEK